MSDVPPSADTVAEALTSVLVDTLVHFTASEVLDFFGPQSLCPCQGVSIGALWLLAWEQRAELLGKGAHTLASMGLTRLPAWASRTQKSCMLRVW